jgi:hypothetical protein
MNRITIELHNFNYSLFNFFHTSGLPYRLLLTCEHASQLMPSPWRWPDEDRRLLNTHWALDMGSEGLCSLNACVCLCVSGGACACVVRAVCVRACVLLTQLCCGGR